MARKMTVCGGLLIDLNNIETAIIAYDEDEDANYIEITLKNNEVVETNLFNNYNEAVKALENLCEELNNL